VQLSASYQHFQSLGFNIAVVTYDSHEDADRFTRQYKVRFPLLRDVDQEHVNRFGLLDESYSTDHYAYGVPKAGIFLIDQHGIVRAKFAEENFRNRPVLSDVISAARQLAEAKVIVPIQ